MTGRVAMTMMLSMTGTIGEGDWMGAEASITNQ